MEIFTDLLHDFPPLGKAPYIRRRPNLLEIYPKLEFFEFALTLEKLMLSSRMDFLPV
jgi:hypothetical protein